MNLLDDVEFLIIDAARSEVAVMLDNEARVLDIALTTKTLLVSLPTFAAEWLGEHEIKLVGGNGVAGKDGTVLHVFGLD